MTREPQGRPRRADRPGSSAGSAAVPGSRDSSARPSAPAADRLLPLGTGSPSTRDADGTLAERISALIEQTRAAVAAQTNTALTLMNWHIGRMIDVEVLRENRAGYGQEIVASLGQQLTERFGRGFDRTNLTRMVSFAQQFPDPEIVASLGQQLSWTHFKALLPVHAPDARAFYIEQAVAARLSASGRCGN